MSDDSTKYTKLYFIFFVHCHLKTLYTAHRDSVGVKQASAVAPGGNSTCGGGKPAATGSRVSLPRSPRPCPSLRSRGKVWEPAQSSAPPRGSGWPPPAPRPAAFSTYSSGSETRSSPASPSGAGTRPGLPSPSCSGSAWCRRWTPTGRPGSWKTLCASSSSGRASCPGPARPFFSSSRPPGLFLSLAPRSHSHPARYRHRRFLLWHPGRFSGDPGSVCPEPAMLLWGWPSQILQGKNK